jgi:hypothetical protein
MAQNPDNHKIQKAFGPKFWMMSPIL